METLEFPDTERSIESTLVINEKTEEEEQKRQSQPFLVQVVGSRPKSFTLPVPKSDLLQRLQTFLPQLRKANEELQKFKSEDLDIEAVSEGSKYIEMDLGLGVFEAKSESKDADLEGLKMPGKATSDTMVSLEDFLSLKKPTGSPSEDESTSNSSLIEELEEASDHSGSSEESL